ncbi:U-box domain-containing protein 44 [Acorus gramineus]|uniref:RING-type E3 ubiquitin transferase n=1 Tax=Acorus gramineus TaxID=55184 RepID=A0AAV9B6I8_ACOGR|nr:U-box domain-containing protein 44 [Acorus gramineus]
MNVAFAVADEALTAAVFAAKDLLFHDDGLDELSRYVSRTDAMVGDLRARGLANAETLRGLASHVEKAKQVIEAREFRSARKAAEGIADAVSILRAMGLDAALDIKSRADQLVADFEAFELRCAASSEAVMEGIERSTARDDYMIGLIEKILKAVGKDARKEEIVSLKREMEEMEERKRQAEVLFQTQLVELMSAPHSPPNASPGASARCAIASFTCPLSGEVMEDPVAIMCGHSFERKAINSRFDGGDKTCPTCDAELSDLGLIPNISLRSSLEEWKQRRLDSKFRNALSALRDPETLNKALDDMCEFCKVSHYGVSLVEHGIVPKLVALLLRTGDVNTKAALKCLCSLAHGGHDNKVAIAKSNAIRCVVKRFCRGETDAEAVSVLVELSENEEILEQIGNTKNCIPSLVSLLKNPNPDVSHNARRVLERLSSNTQFVIKMAEAGLFQPFLDRFHDAPSETSAASMAIALAEMQLTDSGAKHFEDERFIAHLVRTLRISACLHCLKRLSCSHPGIARAVMADANAVPTLLALFSKQDAVDTLVALVEASQPSDPWFAVLQSEENIHAFLRCDTATPVLLAIARKSEHARQLMWSDQIAMVRLVSSLKARREALQLIGCIAEGNPVPLPQSPDKERVIEALVLTFTNSKDAEERSAAAGIIGGLGTDDTEIDEVLHGSEPFMKAIAEVVRAVTSGSSLLENALKVLVRYTETSMPELHMQLHRHQLHQPLVRVLSEGTALAKQRTALVLARLSQSTQLAVSESTMIPRMKGRLRLVPPTRIFPSFLWCYSGGGGGAQCAVHGTACRTPRNAFCLVKADAVRPLVRALTETESGAVEAALCALETLMDGADAQRARAAAEEIADCGGARAVVEVMEKGTEAAKDKAMDLFQKLYEHSENKEVRSPRARNVIISLLRERSLKKKAVLLLGQMEISNNIKDTANDSIRGLAQLWLPMHLQHNGLEMLDEILSQDKIEDDQDNNGDTGYFCGSPPVRLNNPIVNDVQFDMLTRTRTSPLRISTGGKQNASSCRASPKAKIEGFIPGRPDSPGVVPAIA